jgi:hypothetical protein
MRRKQFIAIPFFLIFSLAAFAIGCSCNCGKNSDGDNSLKGYITVIGNEPFTKLALMTGEGKSFVLKCSKELQSELKMNQGNFYLVQYGAMQTEEGNEVITVEKIIPIKKEIK